MGWISARAMQGQRIGGMPKGGTKRARAPLRKIALLLQPANGMFTADWVELECGHLVHTTGSARARCVRCAVTG